MLFERMKKSWKGKPGMHKGRTGYNEKGEYDPKNKSSQDNRHHSPSVALFALRLSLDIFYTQREKNLSTGGNE
jgi:hypothetical protein